MPKDLAASGVDLVQVVDSLRSHGMVPIAADGPNAIRHMVFDKNTRQIPFGGEANMIGRVKVWAPALVP